MFCSNKKKSKLGDQSKSWRNWTVGLAVNQVEEKSQRQSGSTKLFMLSLFCS